MDCDSSEDMAEQQRARTAWVKVQADEYTAIVSTANIFAAHPASLLASLVDLELGTQQADPCVRLDCSAEVAKEVVSVLRQGSRYEPPSDQRLLRALQQQVDYLGLAAPTVPQVSASQEVVLIPSYWYLSLNADITQHMDLQQAGLLMYSGGARGWANCCGPADPRPSELRGDGHPHSGGSCWLASVLRAEATAAGEDLCFCVPNKIYSSQAYPDSAVCLRASTLSARRVAMPPLHKRLRCCDSALAAAQGKLYLLGGSCHLEVPPTTPFEVYDPHLDAWFSAAPPLTGPVSLSNHALVANQQEGLLITLGGCLTSGDKRHRQTRVNDSISVCDLKRGAWCVNPSGCTWPGAATSYSASAVAADPYTILLLTAQHSGNHSCHAVRTCLLDLRMWRWREGTPLRTPGSSGSSSAAAGGSPRAGTAAAAATAATLFSSSASSSSSSTVDEEECLLAHMGLVSYEGSVLAIGGRHYANGSEWASKQVYSYDLKSDKWNEMRELPYPVCHASPVTMRIPNGF